MADGQIDIKEDAAPSKSLASQTHLHGATTVHAEEICIVDSAGNLVNVISNALKVDGSAVTQPVSDGGGAITVDALDLDIRNLVAATDKVDAGLWLGSSAPTVGQKTMANSLPVAVASDQGNLPIGAIAGAITPGTAAGNLGKAEDAVAGSGDTGVSVLVKRLDVPNLPTAAETSANGDYAFPTVDDHGVAWVRKRQLVTYTALYRLIDSTAGTLSLTFTFTANTNKQLATIYHTGASTKTVKIRKISLFLATTAAGIFDFEVRALSATTAPATGNPAITPRTHNPADGAAEATCLALPTTAGSLVGANTGTVSQGVSLNVGAGGAQTTPALATAEFVLYEYKDGQEAAPLIMRAGSAEGFAVNGRCTAAVAQRFTIAITFTEE